MSEIRPTVLVVDDEALIVRLFSIHVESMGLEVCATAATADEAVVKAQQHRPDIILMDVRLRGAKDGVDAARLIRETQDPKIIFITGSTDPAVQAGIRDTVAAIGTFTPRRKRLAISTSKPMCVKN